MREHTLRQLPSPEFKETIALKTALKRRRSVRQFDVTRLSPAHISRILWAMQGITGKRGARLLRAAPSAGATYPLEIYLIDEKGVFSYDPVSHVLRRIKGGDIRNELSRAALGQPCIAGAPVTFVIAAVMERTERRYGQRAERYVYIEVGHAAQNAHLAAVALGLGSVPIGAFRDNAVAELLELPDNHQPVYLIPVGYPQSE